MKIFCVEMQRLGKMSIESEMMQSKLANFLAKSDAIIWPGPTHFPYLHRWRSLVIQNEIFAPIRNNCLHCMETATIAGDCLAFNYSTIAPQGIADPTVECQRVARL